MDVLCSHHRGMLLLWMYYARELIMLLRQPCSPWRYYALTMYVLCSHHESIMLSSWSYYALVMEVLCSCHGGIMLLPWRFMLTTGRYYALTMNGIQLWKSINNKSFLFAKIIPLHVKKCYFRASGNEIMYNNNLYSCDI